MDRRLRTKGRIRIPGTTELLLILLEYAWVLTVILNGNSVYHASTGKDYHLLELCVILTVVLIAVNWFTGRIHLAVREAIVAVGLLLVRMPPMPAVTAKVPTDSTSCRRPIPSAPI